MPLPCDALTGASPFGSRAASLLPIARRMPRWGSALVIDVDGVRGARVLGRCNGGIGVPGLFCIAHLTNEFCSSSHGWRLRYADCNLQGSSGMEISVEAASAV
jgi:hypothetical protein